MNYLTFNSLLQKSSCCWIETDTFIRFSGVWWIINSNIWIIKNKLKIKWGKPSFKCFTKCYKISEETWEMIWKFRGFLSNFLDLQYRKSKLHYTTFGYLQQFKELDNFVLYFWNEIHDISAAVFEHFFSWFKHQLRRLYQRVG